MVDAATLEAFQKLAEQAKDRTIDETSPLQALSTPLEVVAWLIEEARADGFDPLDACELAVMDMDRGSLRELASDLKRLGYRDVADRLRQMVKERRRSRRA